jgi:hypothetical protein
VQEVPSYSGYAGPKRNMTDDIFTTSNQLLGQMPDEVTIASGSGRKSATCLVVEDDGTMRHLVTNYLEDHDIRTCCSLLLK